MANRNLNIRPGLVRLDRFFFPRPLGQKVIYANSASQLLRQALFETDRGWRLFAWGNGMAVMKRR